MLSNFHVFTLARTGERFKVSKMLLHQSLQDALEEDWRKQLEDFASKSQVLFDPSYCPDDNEVLFIEDYEMPKVIRDLSCQSVAELRKLKQSDLKAGNIKAVIGIAESQNEGPIFMFQKFSRAHILKPGMFFLLERGTLTNLNKHAITLGNKLSAVYRTELRTLYFTNFRATNSFLPLLKYYNEATNVEIKQILTQKFFYTESIDSIFVFLNQWFRREFSILKQSGILDRFEPKEVARISRSFNLEIDTVDNKIVFPNEKKEARNLLVFLNEQLFYGPITGKLFETNSKRVLETQG